MERDQQETGRRDGLENDLRRQEKRRAMLRGELKQAEAVHAAAQATLAAAQAALARARTLLAGAEQACAELRHLTGTVDPKTINGLPVELLDAVFDSLAGEPDPLWPTTEDAKYNRARAMLPYQLAAVCRHWRRVALSSSAIWTYLALPPFSAQKMQMKRILPAHFALLLERSRSLAIDVCLDMTEIGNIASGAGISDFRQEVLTLLIGHARRWRLVKLCLEDPSSVFPQLIGQTPLPVLEEFYLQCGGPELSEIMAVPWLSHAPSLRKLFSPDIQFNFVTGTSNVISASFTVDSSTFNTLHSMPLLESLSLDLRDISDSDSVTDADSVPLVLPALKFLKLRGGPTVIASALSLSFIGPQVSRLNLSGDDLAATPGSLVQDFVLAFPNITDLELHGEGQMHYRDTPDLLVQPFSRLKTLALITWVLPDNFISSMDYWVDAASSRRGLVCPDLESLTISYHPREYYEYRFLELAHFIALRAEVCRARQKQFQVAFESWPPDTRLPSWFRQVLAAALGPTNVRLTTSDGVRYDPVADSDEEEEDAEFTDSDGSSAAAVDSDDRSSSGGPASTGDLIERLVYGPLWDTDSEDSDYYTDGDGDQ
ncbi:hypothetical protein AURDEDRAFT_182059 [Auricularia subglabra TFB-10046 SS5]|nr:hypothetical protein AURDEDRAFT_182059 [Auricularia subglabra TFB-10046 SS5]